MTSFQNSTHKYVQNMALGYSIMVLGHSWHTLGVEVDEKSVKPCGMLHMNA